MYAQNKQGGQALRMAHRTVSSHLTYLSCCCPLLLPKQPFVTVLSAKASYVMPTLRIRQAAQEDCMGLMGRTSSPRLGLPNSYKGQNSAHLNVGSVLSTPSMQHPLSTALQKCCLCPYCCLNGAAH